MYQKLYQKIPVSEVSIDSDVSAFLYLAIDFYSLVDNLICFQIYLLSLGCSGIHIFQVKAEEVLTQEQN